jgi:hypothetical protein
MKLRNGKDTTINPLFYKNNEFIMKTRLKYLLLTAIINKNEGILFNERITDIIDIFTFIKQEILEKIIKYNVVIPEDKIIFYEKIFDLVEEKYFQLEHLKDSNVERLLWDCFVLVNEIVIRGLLYN